MSQPKGPASAPAQQDGLADQIKDLDSRFWIVNAMEMFERLAYYGVRAVAAIYIVLPASQGGPELSHIDKGTIFAWWAAVQSLLPMFTGGYADRYGHKKTIAVAIVLKVIGYVMMAYLKDFWGLFFGCMFLAAGTAIFKPGVQGTLAATMKPQNASVGWGIFYQLVNIGGILGPVVAGLLRQMDWSYVFLSCAVIVSINFFWLPFYKDPSDDFEPDEAFSTPLKVLITSVVGLFKPRVFFFCIVFSGFWLMFNQVFDLLPNVIDDWVDTSDVIGVLGTSFAGPTVPTLIALGAGVIYAILCGSLVLLSMRPDRQKTSEVATSAYAIVGIASALAIGLPISGFGGLEFLPESTLGVVGAALIVCGVGLASAVLARLSGLSGKFLTTSLAVVGGASAFVLTRGTLLESSGELVRMAAAGEQIPPEWMINLNPGLIILTMIFFGYLSGKVRPLVSIIVGMVIATVGSVIAGTAVFGFICLGGILVFSVGEMLSSPKKMEYLSTLAPPGQQGLFMGYANIPSAIGWITGSIYAGNKYEEHGDKVNLARKHLVNELGMSQEAADAIDRADVVMALGERLDMTALEVQQLLFETYHPEEIWYDIGLIGLASIIGMVIYDRVVRHLDRDKSKGTAAA